MNIKHNQDSTSLIDLVVYNTNTNVEDGINNQFYLDINQNDNHEVTISRLTGSYKIEDNEKYIKSQFLPEIAFSIKPNNNTPKAEIKRSNTIHFQEKSIGKLIGFNIGTLSANRKHESVVPVDIIMIIVIRIACNIVTWSI